MSWINHVDQLNLVEGGRTLLLLVKPIEIAGLHLEGGHWPTRQHKPNKSFLPSALFLRDSVTTLRNLHISPYVLGNFLKIVPQPNTTNLNLAAKQYQWSFHAASSGRLLATGCLTCRASKQASRHTDERTHKPQAHLHNTHRRSGVIKILKKS